MSLNSVNNYQNQVIIQHPKNRQTIDNQTTQRQQEAPSQYVKQTEYVHASSESEFNQIFEEYNQDQSTNQKLGAYKQVQNQERREEISNSFGISLYV